MNLTVLSSGDVEAKLLQGDIGVAAKLDNRHPRELRERIADGIELAPVAAREPVVRLRVPPVPQNTGDERRNHNR